MVDFAMRRSAPTRLDIASLLLAVLCAAGALAPIRVVGALVAPRRAATISAPREQAAPARVPDAHQAQRALRALRASGAASEPRRHDVQAGPLAQQQLAPSTVGALLRPRARQTVGRTPAGNRAPYDATAPPASL